jgi:hypothetical protein
MRTQNRFSVDWLYILVVIFFMVLIVQAALFTESNKMANARNPDIFIGNTGGCLLSALATVTGVSSQVTTDASRVFGVSVYTYSATGEVNIRDTAIWNRLLTDSVTPPSPVFQIQGSNTFTQYYEFERPIYLADGLLIEVTNANVKVYYSDHGL